MMAFRDALLSEIALVEREIQVKGTEEGGTYNPFCQGQLHALKVILGYWDAEQADRWKRGVAAIVAGNRQVVAEEGEPAAEIRKVEDGGIDSW